MAKRKGEHQRAAELWHELAGDAQSSAHACEQLAIYYERRLKDYKKALEFARRARALSHMKAERENFVRPVQVARREDAYAKRIKRLEARLAKSRGGLLELAASSHP
jgi:hypothetical protein